MSQTNGISTPVSKPVYNNSLVKLIRSKLSRRQAVSIAVVAGNFAVLAVVVGVITLGPQQEIASMPVVNGENDNQITASPLDHVSSAGIAKNVATLSSLPETTAVKNQADSETTELAQAPTAANVADKPQVVASTAYASNQDIKTHTVAEGETISSIATKYNITSDSIRWSNDVTGDSVKVGTKLKIPPVNGMVYTVQSGDTPTTLAGKYRADQNKITAYNDAEITGLKVGSTILIPDGQKAAAVAAAVATSDRGSAATRAVSYSASAASGGYNGYDFGYCTWWVAKLRANSGSPVPMNLGNAATWAKRAAAMGLPTGSTPRVGAAVVTKTAGAGHVAYVTSVNGDGTITVSEMNSKGWNKVNSRVMTPNNFSYVY